MKKCILALLFFYTCVPVFTSAQHAVFSERLDNTNGLSNSCINTIFQDSDNLLWIGTWDGLNIYDGSAFYMFNYDPANPGNNIGNNVIRQIKEGQNKNIWITTMEGISRYNKRSGIFRHYFYGQNKSKSFQGRRNVLSIDNLGSVYCISNDNAHLYEYIPEEDKFEEVVFDKHPSGINKVVFDQQNHLWMIDSLGALKSFHRHNKKFSLDKTVVDNSRINDVFAVNHHLFYTNTNRQFIDITGGHAAKPIQMPAAIRSIDFYDDHYIISWTSKGIGEYDTAFNPINKLNSEIATLQNYQVTSVMAGSENLLWLGTDGSGIMKLGKKENYFGLKESFAGSKPDNTTIRSFAAINNELLVGTKGLGLITITNLGKSNESHTILKSFPSPSGGLDNCIYAIKKSTDGSIYIGSDAPGVSIYDASRKHVVPYTNIENNGYFPKFGPVHALLPDSDGSMWLGTETSGIVHLKINKKTARSFSIDYLNKYVYKEDNSGLGSDIVYALEKGSGSRLYIGCRYGGLTIYDTALKTFNTLRAFSYANSLSNNDVLSLYLSKNHRLWIGTSYGLNWIEEAELAGPAPVFHQLNTENGMPNNTIHAITEDTLGNIWVSTNKGLASINQQSFKIRQFKVSDGLQSNEFSDGAMLNNNNEIFFGGIYGFNYFNPQQIIDNSNQPNLLITEIQSSGKGTAGNRLHVMDAKNNKGIELQLSRQDNFFELNIRAIKFRNADKCQYAYTLSGYDKAWRYLGNNTKIAYSNLPPGDYQLKIKWSNGEGGWGKETTALSLQVKQYFWLTFPAIAVYIVLLVIAAYAFYRYRQNKLQMVHEYKMREKEEQLHQEQLQFFTNIAHELQTPLTLISGSLERHAYWSKENKLASSMQKPFLDIVGQQASRLSYLVYQLLEFRKAETGHLKVNSTDINISNLFSNILQLFEPIKEQKKLELTYQFEKDIILATDKDKMEKIIFNLLSNAFKHSSNNQHIICSLNVSADGRNMELAVANSGCTLPQAQLQQLFTRFFVTDESNQSKISTGIGLALTKELVILLNGTIHVDCKNDWISFKVLLPVTVQQRSNEVVDLIEKSDKPSFLLTAITNNDLAYADAEKNNQETLLEGLLNEEKKSILIVDDEADIRFLLKDILKNDYIVYEAGSGKEALDILTRISPNLIISDVMMPDMSGLQLCQVVKNTLASCHIPFIMLTARGTVEQKTEGYEAGADAYIPKPFDSRYLLVRIRKLLDYQQKLHDLFKQDHVTSFLSETGLKEEDKEFLQSIVSLIEANIENELLNAEFIEKKVGVSRTALYRRLKALSNLTPGELILQIRLEQAAHLLKSTEDTVAEIFYRSGFNNRSHFFREFKKKYKIPPAEYRAAHRIGT